MLTKALAVIAIGLLAVGATLSGNGGDPVALGTVKMDGGSDCVTFSTASVPVTGNPDVSGRVKNDTGGIVTDVTVEVKATKPTSGDPKPPELLGININGAGATQGSGTSLNVSLNATQQIQIGGEVSATVDLGPPVGVPPGTASTEFVLCFTPSTSKGGSHYDVLEAYEMRSTSGDIENKITSPHNSGLAAVLRNADTSRSITSFTGEVSYPGTQSFTINSVDLLDDFGGTAVSGTSVSIDDDEFTVSNFDELEDGAKYVFYVNLSVAPSGGPVKVKINATFAP